MGLYYIVITKRNQKKIGEILVENKVLYNNKPITQETWNKITKKAEYITFHDNGKFLNWWNTYDKPIRLYLYEEIPIYALRDTILTGKYEPSDYDHLFMSKQCMIPKKKYYYYY